MKYSNIYQRSNVRYRNVFYFNINYLPWPPPPHPRVSDQCMNMKKNPCIHFLDHACSKSCPQTGTDVQTDGQIDRQTEKQSDGQTDRQTPIYPQTSFAGEEGIINVLQKQYNQARIYLMKRRDDVARSYSIHQSGRFSIYMFLNIDCCQSM